MSATETPNFDPDAKISYGVLSPNSVDPEALSIIYDNGTDLGYENWLEETKKELHSVVVRAVEDLVSASIADDMADAAVDAFCYNAGDCYNSDGDTEYAYQAGDLHILLSQYLVVTKSPYFTICQNCSPCYPNAGNLDKPRNKTHAGEVSVPDPRHVLYGMVRGPLKAYCLPSDWFEEAECPYNVYEVATGKCIYKAPQAQKE